MGGACGDEAGGGGTEDELEQLTGLRAHVEASPVLVYAHDGAGLERATEVRDARTGADAGELARGFEHEPMLRRRRRARGEGADVARTDAGQTVPAV